MHKLMDARPVLARAPQRVPSALSSPWVQAVVILAVLAAFALIVGIVVLSVWRPYTYTYTRRPSGGASAKLAGFAPQQPSTFPIDVVCFWADGSDEVWRAQVRSWFPREKTANPAMFHDDTREPEPVPPHSRDELYYGVRSILKHIPWVRTYHLVTQRPHVPWWWPANGSLGAIQFKLVHHDLLFEGEEDRLPCFNSGALQARLAKIPELAEHFILFDDDFMVGQPMGRELFFTPDGRPVARMRAMTYLPWRLRAATFTRMLAHGIHMVKRAVPKPFTPVWFPAHVAVPCTVTIWKEVTEKLFPAKTLAMGRFRSTSDFTVHYVALGVLARRKQVQAMPSWVRTRYFATGKLGKFGKRAGSNLRSAIPHLFCVNNRMDELDRAVLDALFFGGEAVLPNVPHS